jgi:hypothetical protein
MYISILYIVINIYINKKLFQIMRFKSVVIRWGTENILVFFWGPNIHDLWSGLVEKENLKRALIRYLVEM